MHTYYVYILSSNTRVLYIGVTNNLARRLAQHRTGEAEFTRRYRIKTLVYFESTRNVQAAIAREKQIKNWNRGKKLALIRRTNPYWTDLSVGWTVR